MSAENKGNAHAALHLIDLENSIPDEKRTHDYHKAIISALGEVGGIHATLHLIDLEKSVPDEKRTYDYHKAIISALARAGRAV
ncbi:MAG: hypothetical protein RR448_12350 [Niameybacter sp.]